MSVYSRVITSGLDKSNTIKYFADASGLWDRLPERCLSPFLRFHAPILELFGGEQAMTQVSYQFQ